jgi:hypothetical protein
MELATAPAEKREMLFLCPLDGSESVETADWEASICDFISASFTGRSFLVEVSAKSLDPLLATREPLGAGPASPAFWMVDPHAPCPTAPFSTCSYRLRAHHHPAPPPRPV